jgi:glutamate formiminotransferase
MPQTIVESVPNFSEGRDASKVDAIVEAIRSVRGIAILDREMDADHNRSVITFAGPATAVVEAAYRGVERAVDLIDLRVHKGVHPRIGACDVVPFVPVEGVTLEDCVRLANELGARLWGNLHLPVYLYEAAARRPDRLNLENIRRGQFEGLRDEVRTNPDRLPDFGEAELHPSAGATVVGARKFLIAYNINLNTADVEIAKRIAKAIRFSSGGFRYVKSMGVPLASRNLAQVSMNLTDFEQTPIHRVFETVRAEAARHGASIVGSEIVGLIPKRALEMTAEWYLQVENFHPSLVLENRLAEAATVNGLNEFLDELAAPTATPGGGSAAAAAAAMAAALGAMVSGLAKLPGDAFEADRKFFAEAV